MRRYTPGPPLRTSRRRRRRPVLVRLAALILIIAAGWLWIHWIGDDLDSTAGGDDREMAIAAPAAITPAGPAAALAPGAAQRIVGAVPTKGAKAASGHVAGRDLVAHALLSTAKDHVARRVHATWGSVADLESLHGSHIDLIERALAQVGFPLRSAVVRHRFREPRRFGLSRRPPATTEERRRALTVETLKVFLDAFATRLESQVAAGGDNFAAGDLVVVTRRALAGREIFAVVSDRTDDRGVSLLVTLDPIDRHARETHPLDDYEIGSHYRLKRAHLAAARSRLDMPRDSAPAGSAAL